jgi:predicted ATPase/DNA-binding winged helix-turn-helix (wHTH) protein
MRYVGDGFTVDSAAFTVERDGHPVDLEPQAMDLLLYMIARPDELLTKADLLDNVWGDQFVGDAALATRVKQVRAALGDDGRAQRIIQTVHGRGYKFVGLLDAAAVPGGDEGAPVASDVADGVDERHNIPSPRTAMVGRVELVAEVTDAVASDRLVTLVGLGGAGKTTIAQAAGRALVDHFDRGVWFVDLIPVRDDLGLVRAVADGLGHRLGPDSTLDDLVAWLSRQAICIVLDNCEHVVDAAAAFCTAVLDRAPDVHLLATSREPLRLIGERRISVGPLPLGGGEGSALELLERVAQRAGASIAESERADANQLCVRVDGLPLAIELVGARLATFALADIVERLDQLGVGGGERRADRHASLGVVLAETLAGLTDDAIRFLTLLARVTGSFDLDDVEGLAAALGLPLGFDTLADLVDRSLVVVVSQHPRRFGVLEMVRQHVGAHDPDPDATGTAHAEWCRAMLGDRVATHFHDLGHASRVAGRFQDLVDAQAHLGSIGRGDDGARIVAATGLAMHLDDGGRAAVMLELMERHTRSVDDATLRCRLHCSGVMAAMAARDHQAMYQHGVDAVAAVESIDDPTLEALALVMRSWAGVVLDVDAALLDLDEAVRLAESVDDLDTAMMATGYKVLNLAMALRFEEAVEIGEAALARDLGRGSYPRRVVATGLISCLLIDDPRRALDLDERLREGAGTALFWGTAIVRAACYARLGALEEMLERVIGLEERLDRAGISPLPDILIVPATLALTRGDAERAGRYLGAIRAADAPTQSLMVSTAYRVLRSHIDTPPVEQIPGSTAAIWAEARAWLDTDS